MEGSGEESCSESSYSHSQPQWQAVKDRLAIGFMKELHKAFFTEVYEGRFLKPTRRAEVPVQKSAHGSTAASGEEVSENRGPKGSVEEWKVNLITGLLLSFEERLLEEKVLDEAKLRVFRSLNRGLLGLVLEHIVEFRNQKYSSLACSILMINSSKVKVPKEVFNKTISSMETMSRMNLTSVSAVKRSKGFVLLKRLLETQGRLL